VTACTEARIHDTVQGNRRTQSMEHSRQILYIWAHKGGLGLQSVPVFDGSTGRFNGNGPVRREICERFLRDGWTRRRTTRTRPSTGLRVDGC
jgi:hypothetical protein